MGKHSKHSPRNTIFRPRAVRDLRSSSSSSRRDRPRPGLLPTPRIQPIVHEWQRRSSSSMRHSMDPGPRVHRRTIHHQQRKRVATPTIPLPVKESLIDIITRKLRQQRETFRLDHPWQKPGYPKVKTIPQTEVNYTGLYGTGGASFQTGQWMMTAAPGSAPTVHEMDVKTLTHVGTTRAISTSNDWSPSAVLNHDYPYQPHKVQITIFKGLPFMPLPRSIMLIKSKDVQHMPDTKLYEPKPAQGINTKQVDRVLNDLYAQYAADY